MKTRISRVFRVVGALVSVVRAVIPAWKQESSRHGWQIGRRVVAACSRPWRLDSGGPAGMTAFCRALCAGAARAGVAGVLLALSAVAGPAHAQAVDVAVLHSRVDNIDATLARMDGKLTNRLDRMDNRLDRMEERFERVEANIAEIKENAARTDEKVNALQMQNQFVVIPLSLLTLGALIALLTKGHYWGVERKPKESRRGAAAAPVAAPA